MSSFKNPALVPLLDEKGKPVLAPTGRPRLVLRSGFHKKRVQTQFAKEADINLIAQRFLQTGELPAGRNSLPQFGDASQIPVGTDALALRRKAMNAFQSLPLPVLQRFDYSLQNFAQTLSTPAGVSEIQDMLKPYVSSPSAPAAPAAAAAAASEPTELSKDQAK